MPGSYGIHPCRRSQTDSGAVGRLPGPFRESPPVPVMGGRAGEGRGSDFSSKELSTQVLRSLRKQLRENALWELRVHGSGSLSLRGKWDTAPRLWPQRNSTGWKWVFFRVRREPGRAGGADSPGCLSSVGPEVADPEGAGAAPVPL